MPSTSAMIFLIGVPMSVGCCAILCLCWCRRFKKPRGPHKKKISISDKGWHSVFSLLSPRQLGLQIALISRQFDARVDDHLETRRRTLGTIRIWPPPPKTGKHGAKTEVVRVVNAHGRPVPMPTKPMPDQVVAFNGIFVNYLDHNVLAFLHHFRRPLFTTAHGTLSIKTHSVRLLGFILRNIAPSSASAAGGVHANPSSSHAHANANPSSSSASSGGGVHANANPSSSHAHANANPSSSASGGVHANANPSSSSAADGRALLIDWLCPSLPGPADEAVLPPKMLSLGINQQWTTTTTDQIKLAFLRASSPANFICVFRDPRYEDFSGCILFANSYEKLINEKTGEQLTLERRDNNEYLLVVRCPIARAVHRWRRWEAEAIGWNYDNVPYQRTKFDGQRNRIIVSVRDVPSPFLDDWPFSPPAEAAAKRTDQSSEKGVV